MEMYLEFVKFGNESFTKVFVLITVRGLNENFLAFFKEETGNITSFTGESFRKLFTVSVSSSYFFNCFDFVVKMRRDTFGSLEDASDVISFLFCRNFRLPMRR